MNNPLKDKDKSTDERFPNGSGLGNRSQVVPAVSSDDFSPPSVSTVPNWYPNSSRYQRGGGRFTGSPAYKSWEPGTTPRCAFVAYDPSDPSGSDSKLHLEGGTNGEA